MTRNRKSLNARCSCSSERLTTVADLYLMPPISEHVLEHALGLTLLILRRNFPKVEKKGGGSISILRGRFRYKWGDEGLNPASTARFLT